MSYRVKKYRSTLANRRAVLASITHVNDSDDLYSLGSQVYNSFDDLQAGRARQVIEAQPDLPDDFIPSPLNP